MASLRNIVKLLITIIIILSCISSLKAQEMGISFDQINTETGLSSNRINSVVQDSTGFLWIATDDD